MDRWKDGKKEGQVDRQTDGRVDRWKGGQKEGWTEGRVDGRMEGRKTDRRTEGEFHNRTKKHAGLLFWAGTTTLPAAGPSLGFTKHLNPDRGLPSRCSGKDTQMT